MPLHQLCCDRQPRAEEALRFVWDHGGVERLAFGDLARASRGLADALAGAGVGAGVAVALVLPQCPLAAVAHLALSRLGAIAVPLSPMFGVDGLRPRLEASGAALALVHQSRADAVREAAPGLPIAATEGGRDVFPIPPARPSRRIDASGAMALVFTSGTTAQPKGALLPHRVVAGRMAGMALAHPGFPAPGDRFWSPADWSWIGGLYDALFAPLAAGVPVLAYERRGPFDPARAAALLGEHGVRNAFLAPTGLRAWMRSGAPAVSLRTLHTAGEPLPAPVHDWAAKAFGATPREVYGLTECAFLVVNRDAVPDVTGQPVPGQEVRVLREDGKECKAGEPGELAVRSGSPTMMLGYWSGGKLDPALDPYGWLRTRDLAVRDTAGKLKVLGRLDDVVKVRGYRVAPREVEQELLRHPMVEECAVVGVPDEERGHALRAFVKAQGSDALAEELRALVRERLAAHMVPRDVVFVDELPRTTSGKVLRRELRGPCGVRSASGSTELREVE